MMREDIDHGVYNDETLNLKSYPLDIKHIPALAPSPVMVTQPITGDVNMVDDDSYCSCPSLVNSLTDESSVGNEDLFDTDGLPVSFAPDCDGKVISMNSDGNME
jgi:hypothetical protein